MTIFLSYHSFINWLEQHLFACPSKKWFHLECPGCGMQRSFMALLKGDLPASLALYPPLIPIIFLFTFTFLHLRYKYHKGDLVIKYSYIVIAILIMGFYIYKIINNKIIA